MSPARKDALPVCSAPSRTSPASGRRGNDCGTWPNTRQAATRLRRVFDDTHLVARIGGDEFAVMLKGPLAPARIRRMLRRALDALCRPVLWNGQRIDIGASIGVTMLGRPGARKPSACFAEADAALYAAKAAGRKRVHVFGAAQADLTENLSFSGSRGAICAATHPHAHGFVLSK